jgi:hypothetical protein
MPITFEAGNDRREKIEISALCDCKDCTLQSDVNYRTLIYVDSCRSKTQDLYLGIVRFECQPFCLTEVCRRFTHLLHSDNCDLKYAKTMPFHILICPLLEKVRHASNLCTVTIVDVGLPCCKSVSTCG